MAYTLKKEILLNASKKEVWQTYRDKLTQMVDAMATVDSITVISREEIKEGVLLKNRWNISGGVPKAIKRVVPQKLLSYDDEASWHENEYICYFTEKPIDGSEIYVCKGKNEFVELGEQTLLTISFELIIHPEKIPGVPNFIAKGIVPKIEQLISKEVAKNLAATAKVVEEFINSK